MVLGMGLGGLVALSWAAWYCVAGLLRAMSCLLTRFSREAARTATGFSRPCFERSLVIVDIINYHGWVGQGGLDWTNAFSFGMQ
ncbi:hypothetical protein B0T22DRAFT_472483 [Podospora appendiculata]|uniref:Uncharacterized protein n=1 Tax=Podospora appendiculata TaxID=314037 RepID=A0AAE0WZF6_9PEZI|nr:hypothetical protein B0T22DRAFT_472483 [Podospora appendiculata]